MQQAKKPLIMATVYRISALPPFKRKGKAPGGMVKAFGEASMTDNGLNLESRRRQFAFGQVRDAVSRGKQQIES